MANAVACSNLNKLNDQISMPLGSLYTQFFFSNSFFSQILASETGGLFGKPAKESAAKVLFGKVQQETAQKKESPQKGRKI